MLEWLHKALFAFLSGFSELIFTSTAAQQLLYRTLTGYNFGDHFLSFGIHFGCLLALVFNCQKRIKRLRNEKRLDRPSSRRRGRQPDIAALMDVRILNTAVIPLLIGFLLYDRAVAWVNGSLRIALALIVNGAILFLPRLLKSGDKNGRTFTQMDGLLLGMAGVLGILPGFSRIGCMYSVGTARGAAKNYALELSLLLSIPAIAAMLCLDFYGCATTAGGLFGLQLIGTLVAALTSYAGAHLSIMFIRYICSHSTTVGFAYYSWGQAIFLLLIYLFVA